MHLAICAWEWPAYYDKDAIDRGVRLTVSRWRRPDPRSAPIEAKASGHYMILTLSKHEAMRAGFDDALLLDLSGSIAEASSANIFFRRGAQLHTPRTGNMLNGITRQTVIGLARAQGMEVRERDITPDELGDFEEAFITGTACELMAVCGIDDAVFASREAITSLKPAFHALCYGHQGKEQAVA